MSERTSQRVRVRVFRYFAEPAVHIRFYCVTRRYVRLPRDIGGGRCVFYSEDKFVDRHQINPVFGGVWKSKARDDYRLSLRSLGVTPYNCDRVLDQVSGPGKNLASIFIDVENIVRTVHDYSESLEFSRFAEDWIGSHLPSEQEHKTVAGDKSAGVALEKVKFGGAVLEGKCVICLEEFEDGVELTKMPCSHLFHVNCVTTWLEVNHQCPLCRFPIASCSA